jgi:hypothetical protein
MDDYECWAWLEQSDDGWRLLIVPGSVTAAPELLVGRTEFGARDLRHIADWHSHFTGRPVRLAHLVEAP